MKLWKRKCPRCRRMVSYKSKYSRNKYRKRGLTCNHCKASKENLSLATLKKRSNSLKLVVHTWHNKITQNRKRNGTYFVPENIREKHRINKVERMIRNGILIWPNFNINACKIFGRIEKDLGWDGFYATKGKEKRIGRFWIDYYEPKRNVVIEFDEPHHFNKDGALKEKDIKRQNWIENATGCKFYRINENTKYDRLKNILSHNLP